MDNERKDGQEQPLAEQVGHVAGVLLDLLARLAEEQAAEEAPADEAEGNKKEGQGHD